NIAAAIDINAVAVRVDRQVVDGEIVHADSQDAEVPAMQNGKIAERHIAAILQGDCFVADPRVLCFRLFASRTPAQSLAPNLAGAKNGYVLHAFAPDKAVMPMAVPVVLELVPLIRFCRVILTCVSRFSSHDRGAWVEIQADLALQVNRKT